MSTSNDILPRIGRLLFHKSSLPISDAYRAIEPISVLDRGLQLPNPELAYKMISSRIRAQGQDICSSYYGRRAVHYILSHSAIRHIALALGSLCSHAETLIIIHDEPASRENGLETLGRISHEMQGNNVCLNIHVFNDSRFDNNLSLLIERHFGWFPASTIVHCTMVVSLIYLSGSADPAHLAAQGHILYLSSLAEREQFALNCRKSSHSHHEEDASTEESRDNLSSASFQLIRKLRTLLLRNTDDIWRLLEPEEPGLKKAYSEILDQRERALDASIVADLKRLQTRPARTDTEDLVLDWAKRLMPSTYPDHGLNLTGPLSRSSLRTQMIAKCVDPHIGTEPGDPACALPEVTKWYNHYIRPFLESFSARTGIAEVEEESPIHLLADLRVNVQPQHDPGIEKLMFAQDSLEIAQDPFALLYYGAYSGNLALVKRYRALSHYDTGESIAPIIAAIQSKHFHVISWLIKTDQRQRYREEVVLAAARSGRDVLHRVMEHMDLTALYFALYQIGKRKDDNENDEKNDSVETVETMTQWLKDNPNKAKKETSLYMIAMDTAAAYNLWEDVNILSMNDAIVLASDDDLAGEDDPLEPNENVDTMRRLIGRAALLNDNVVDMNVLKSLLKRVEEA